ncbi:DUF4194 domain-containing protein [Prosthecobacter sp.]|jgi:hypothetical protein|uniref:DUF4194 domain-containing protein n=1 Tax=Prosthecobacter sp. TaxID=1965333 RepID=UPI0037846491
MTEAAPNLNDTPAPEPLLRLQEQDRARLAEALQELLAHGSLLGLESGQSALYNWCRQNFEWLRETAALAGLDVALLHDERMVQAIPRVGSMVLHLRQDATLVWLALWYAADVRWRDEGETQAFLTVTELNALLKDQLLPDAVGQIARGRLREILRQAARFNLIRFQPAEPFEDSGIEVLPAIRRVVPFRELAEWNESAGAFKKNDATAISNTDEEVEA